MKAVVLELRGGKAAVLDHDGIVRIVKNESYQVGQVIEVSSVTAISPVRSFVQRHLVPMAASFAVLLFAGGTATAYAMPYSIVTMEREASLKYTLNIFDRVISVEGEDAEGIQISEEISGDVRGKRIEEAVTMTLDRLAGESYAQQIPEPGTDVVPADAPERDVVITVQSHLNRESRLEQKIDAAVENWNAENPEPQKAPETLQAPESRKDPEMQGAPADGRGPEAPGSTGKPDAPEDRENRGTPEEMSAAESSGVQDRPETAVRPEDSDTQAPPADREDADSPDRAEDAGSAETQERPQTAGNPVVAGESVRPEEAPAVPGETAALAESGEAADPAPEGTADASSLREEIQGNTSEAVPAGPGEMVPETGAEAAAGQEEIGPGIGLEQNAADAGSGTEEYSPGSDSRDSGSPEDNEGPGADSGHDGGGRGEDGGDGGRF